MALQEAFSPQRRKRRAALFTDLENVQGDERDVIYISTSLRAMEIAGSVPQRLARIHGPAAGWRRHVRLLPAPRSACRYLRPSRPRTRVGDRHLQPRLTGLRDFLHSP